MGVGSEWGQTIQLLSNESGKVTHIESCRRYNHATRNGPRTLEARQTRRWCLPLSSTASSTTRCAQSSSKDHVPFMSASAVSASSCTEGYGSSITRKTHIRHTCTAPSSRGHASGAESVGSLRGADKTEDGRAERSRGGGDETCLPAGGGEGVRVGVGAGVGARGRAMTAYRGAIYGVRPTDAI